MKITKYRMEQLEEARKIQQDCIKQHLPCPPVAWWQGKIIDEKGNIEELIESKCNSYTRNGLNLLAINSLYIPTSKISATVFGDGVVSVKDKTGSLLSWNGTLHNIGISTIHSNGVYLGTGTEPESIDVFTIIDSSLPSSGRNNFGSISFDLTSRKLLSIMNVSYLNNTDSNYNITESGIYATAFAMSTNGNYTGRNPSLLVRDLFESPIVIPPGKSLYFNYNFELLYPE